MNQQQPAEKMVRIDAEAHAALKELAEADRRSMTQEVAWLIFSERGKRAWSTEQSKEEASQ